MGKVVERQRNRRMPGKGNRDEEFNGLVGRDGVDDGVGVRHVVG